MKNYIKDNIKFNQNLNIFI